MCAIEPRIDEANIVKPFLQEIIAVGGLSIKQIAYECHISESQLCRLMQDKVIHTSPYFFNKILCLYCAVCYDQTGHKINQEIIYVSLH